MSREDEQRMYSTWWMCVHEHKNKKRTRVALFIIYFSPVVQNGLYVQGKRAHPGRVGHPDIPGML